MVKDEQPHGLLERAISTFAPQWAYRRQVAREKMAFVGAWKGASRARAALAGWNPVKGTSADEDNLTDLPDLIARSRDLVRSSPLATGAVGTTVLNVVGTGLALDPCPDHALLGISEDEAEQWEENTLREFRLWAESANCDITRHDNFYGLQALTFRAVLEGGDCLALTPAIRRMDSPYMLAVQLIEAERLCNPNNQPDNKSIAGGVERDTFGAPLAYHIASDYPVGRRTSRASLTWTRVPAFGGKSGRRSVLHLFDRTRPGQSRGIPFLAPVIEPLKQLDRYSDAELQAAVISGAFSVFIKMDPTAFGDLFEDGDAYLDAAKQWDGALPTGTLTGPGKAINLLPGESIESANPGRPNAQFDPFVQAVLRQIGVALGLPFEILVKHFTSSYSAARAALLDAWRFFRARRDWLATHFCQPLYEIWLDEAVASGRIAAPGYFADPAIRRAWSRATWIGDGPGSIDPEKEVRAAKGRVELGISTREAESIMFDGGDWDAKHRQLVKEEAARKEGGLIPEPSAPTDSIPTPSKSEEATANAMTAIAAAMARPLPAPQITVAPADVKIDNHVASPAATVMPAPVVQIDNHLAPTPVQVAVSAPEVDVHVEAIMPGQSAPVVQLDMPSPTVIMQHPTRAIATHERDSESLEVLRTVTEYQLDRREE